MARPNSVFTGIAGPHSPEVFAQTDWNDDVVRNHLARLAQVARATASAVIITDVRGVTVWVNDGFTRITGYTFEEAVGSTPGRLLQGPETDRAETARIDAALRSRQSVAAELVNYGKDGRRYWIGMKIEPLTDVNGRLEGFMAIEADITARHERSRELELMTRRFNMATRAAHVGVYERDVDGEHVWWNDVMFQLYGQDPATFKPTRSNWLELIHPDDYARIQQVWSDATESPASWDLQYRVVMHGGTLRYLQSVGSTLEKLSEPDSSRISGMVLDITDRVNAQLREQQLQEKLREGAHQAGMAEIAAGVLHNVGNVLNSLGVANDTARRELRTFRLDRLQQATVLLRNNRATLADFLSSDERGRHLPDYLPALSDQLSSNSRAVQAELETTDQLLHHLSEIIRAQQEFAHLCGRRESVQLSDLIETALLVQASGLAQIEVLREYEELSPVSTDRHKLLQILVNLISNACEAIQLAAAEPRRISVKIACEGEYVVAVFADSGIGMSEDVLAKIWQFGFTTKKDGHGFGLHNSAIAAHEIGATLTAHSDGVGRGSRFTLRLPRENSESMHPGVAT